MTATVVLVHGAFHGSGYWRATLKGLADLGISAIAPDLPGHGADPRPLADLHGDADAVREVLDSVPGPVVLVGHSYGGAVVTDAGVHPNVEHVVVLAGYLLEEGETVANAGAAAEIEGIDHSGRPRLSSALHIENGIGTIADPEAARRVFYSDFDDEQVAEILTMTSPQRMDSFSQHPRHHVIYEKPTTYVVCKQDMTVHPHIQRVLARRSRHAAAWDCGHFPMVTQPDHTVGFLAQIAEQY
jgi:pimeloyl-ACP methyl ester carboxylesterase